MVFYGTISHIASLRGEDAQTDLAINAVWLSLWVVTPPAESHRYPDEEEIQTNIINTFFRILDRLACNNAGH